MTCPHCTSDETTKRSGSTSAGYTRFACHACGRRFNERTGRLFNDLQNPTDSARSVAVAGACPSTSTKRT